MRVQKTIFFIALAIVSSCKDPFDIPIENLEGRLVVNGVISDLLFSQYIRLGMTVDPKISPKALAGALVSITDETGNKEFLQDLQDGRYQFNQLVVKAKKGGSYTLDIQLPNGHQYQSTSETMPSVLGTDSAYFKVEKEKLVSSEGISIENTNVKIFLNTNLPEKSSTPSFLRWGIDEVYAIIPTCPPGALACPAWCYIYQPVSTFNLKVIKTTDYQENSIKDLLMQTRTVDFTFLVRHYFNVTQYSMNQNAYEYWKQVDLIVSRTGSIFDTPPATIQGNVHNVNDPSETVYGYFEASSTHITRVFVDRGFIPIDLKSCTYDFSVTNGSVYGYCLNCLSLKGSTIEQPSWFF